MLTTPMYTETKKLVKITSCSHRNLKWGLKRACFRLYEKSWKCPPKNVFLLVGLEVTHSETKTVLHSTYNIKKKKNIWSTPCLWERFLSLSKLDLCVDPMIGCYCILQLSKSFVLTSNRISKKHVSKSSFLPARKDHSCVFLTSGSDRFSFLGGYFFTSIYSLTNTRLKSSVIYAY